MSDGNLYLCLDQGGHSSRALVLDAAGQVLASASRPVDTRRDGVQVEHCPQQLVETLQESAGEALDALGGASARVVAAGLATQRSSIVCWNRETREPISKVLSWQDTRATDWLAQFEAHWQQVHELTGLVLSPYYGASKLRWCLDNLPDVAAARANRRLYCGPLASFLAHSLTGHADAFADPANGSRTLLWDRSSGDWSAELLQLFGVSRECLPQAVRSRHAWGHLRLGSHRIPLTIVTGDQSAALFAFGKPRSDTVYANLGTGAFVQQAAAPGTDPGRLLASVVYRDSEQTAGVIEGTVNGAGSALSLIAAERDIRREVLHANSAAWLEAEADPPLFVNAVGGLGSPWWRSDVATGFADDVHSDGAAVAGVLESIVFLLHMNLQQLQGLLGKPARIVATGGLASVDPLLQRLADCSTVAVQRAQVREATATGLAWLLAGLPREWPGVDPAAEFLPASNHELHDRYRRWLQLMPASG